MILPRWVLRAGWAVHKGLYARDRRPVGLEAPIAGSLGTLRLHTRGRRSGEPRSTFLFYVEDGAELAIAASNAGDDREPAWWLNLEARPDAEVDLVDGCVSRPGARRRRRRTRPRLGAVHRAQPRYAAYETAAARPIDVVLLEPR